MPEIPGPDNAENNIARADQATPAPVEAPGPTFESPTPEQQAAHRQASEAARAEARAAVESADNSQTAQQALRGRDVEGGNDAWGYNPGNREQHQVQQKQAAEQLRSDNTTTLDNATTAAPVPTEKPTLLGRVRKLLGR